MPSLEVATGSSFCSFSRVASFCRAGQAGYGHGKQLRPTLSSRSPPPLVVAPSKKTCCFLVESPRQVSCLCYKKLDVNEEPELGEGRLVQTTTDHQQSWGVAVVLTLLSFYRREISPFLPRSCRFVPSCSEYSMQAYRKYGVLKGTILTAWRLMRCNPFGPSGYDPPRWFGESRLPDI